MKRFMSGLALVLCLAAPSFADGYPARPIDFIIPFDAGTGSDVATRMILDQIKTDTGANFVVDNRPGGSGVVGVAALQRAANDGYTVMMSGTSSHALAPSLSKGATYKPVDDFTHIAITTKIPFAVVVGKQSPYKSIADLVANLKANPGKANFGFGSGSTRILAVKMQKDLGLEGQPISYKSSREAITDLLGGTLDYMVIDAAAGAGLVKSGEIRALAMLSEDRSPLMADVPSLAEAGFSVETLVGYTGVAGPKDMPAEAREWLAKAFKEALAVPALREKLLATSAEPAEEADPTGFVATQLGHWSKAAENAGITPQ